MRGEWPGDLRRPKLIAMELWLLALLCLVLGFCAGRYAERRRKTPHYTALPQNEDEMPLKSALSAEPSEVSSLREQLSKEQEITRVGPP